MPFSVGLDGVEHEDAVVFDSLGGELGMAEGNPAEGLDGVDVELSFELVTFRFLVGFGIIFKRG